MKKLLLCLAACALLAGCAEKEAVPTALLYVGTHTDTDSRGIYAYRFDPQELTAEGLDTLVLQNPAYLALSHTGKYLYAASEETDTARALVTAAAIDAEGRTKTLEAEKTGGSRPCYVSTNGTLIYVANDGDGSMSVFPIEADGSVAEIAVQYFGTFRKDGGELQSAPHVRCALPMPNQASIVFSDVSGDRLYIVHQGGRNDSVSMQPGFAPSRLAFTDDGGRLYAASALSDAVAVLSCNGYMLTPLQLAEADTTAGRTGLDLQISPDKRFLYLSTEGKQDGIAIFSIDKATGRLTRKGFQRTGRRPQSVALTKDGALLLCVCHDEDKVQVFRRDPETGQLTDTGKDIALPHPTCIKIQE